MDSLRCWIRTPLRRLSSLHSLYGKLVWKREHDRLMWIWTGWTRLAQIETWCSVFFLPRASFSLNVSKRNNEKLTYCGLGMKLYTKHKIFLLLAEAIKCEVLLSITAFDLVTLVQTLQRLQTTTNSVIIAMLYAFHFLLLQGVVNKYSINVYKYHIHGNFRQEKVFTISPSALMGEIFIMQIFLSCVNDYIEDMAIFITLAKIYFISAIQR